MLYILNLYNVICQLYFHKKPNICLCLTHIPLSKASNMPNLYQWSKKIQGQAKVGL